ncbi:hypothetical protein PybrP1_003909 [[Pythium] brassicae (nom. inval.)]|nr:hypothetical protein PybrP1_003909 [[Pythium] brassicae (nom. inval.)]
MASIASISERKLAATNKQPQQTIALDEMAGTDSEEQRYLLLHLVRVLALYIYVFLSQNPLLAGDALLHQGAEHASKLERELHAVLLACVEADVASNQFDGLVQEKRVFVAIKKLFRRARAEPEAQGEALLALLSSYLSRMSAPIVTCAPFSMVLSTLEYLATQSATKGVSLSLLYPIVNALLAKLVSRHQSAVIQVEGRERASQQQPVTGAAATLGACFVATLLRYSDHIFRHDPEHCEPETPGESDTEDESALEDVSEPEQPAPLAPPLLTKVPTLPLLTAAEVEVAGPVVVAAPASKTSGRVSPSSAAKTLSKSMRRRKKKADEKLASAAVAKPLPLLKKEEEARTDGGGDAGNQLNPAEDESLATVVCVGIAAAAGTIAAALCVIFT